MDLQKTGKLIAELRHEKGMTQQALADKLGISAKAVSKWETGHGFPDISLISELSGIFGVDVSKIICGEMPKVRSEGNNVKKTTFFVCEKCGNILTSIKDAEVACCGRKLIPLTAKKPDGAHTINVENVEDDYYITFPHPMTKEHYISFVSYVRFDRVLTVKLYPEQGGELRIPQMRGGKLYYFCSTHGLFELTI